VTTAGWEISYAVSAEHFPNVIIGSILFILRGNIDISYLIENRNARKPVFTISGLEEK
jgi:hypothetical protein